MPLGKKKGFLNPEGRNIWTSKPTQRELCVSVNVWGRGAVVGGFHHWGSYGGSGFAEGGGCRGVGVMIFIGMLPS